MNNINFGGMSVFGWAGTLFYIAFWAGVVLLAYYAISKAANDDKKIYLTVGLILVIGSLLLTTLFGGQMMMRGMWNSGMMQNGMKEMMKDDEIRKEMKEMMEEVEQEK